MRPAGKRVIVVGSGPTGAAAARRLVERGVRVIMVEAGSAPPRGLVVRAAGNVLLRRFPSRGMSVEDLPTADRGAIWYRADRAGGLSNFWTSAVPRFAPDDFTEGGQISASLRWPIGYEDVAPYYDHVERVLGVTAADEDSPLLPRQVARYRRRLPDDWRPVAEAAHRLGHHLTVMPMAVGSRWMLRQRGTEFNSFHDIVRPLTASPDFELRLGTKVLEVLPTDRRGPGIRCHDGTGIVDVRASAVLLAAGPLATTRLLLGSRSQDAPDGLGNSRDVLGRYLHDHPSIWWPCRTSHRLTLPGHPLYMTRAKFGTVAPLTGRSWTIGLRRPGDRPRTYLRSRGRDFGVQVFGTMLPRAENRVLLLDGADGAGDAAIGIELEQTEHRRDAIMRSSERLRAVFGAAGIDLDAPDELEIAPAGNSVHFGGTVRMHDDPEFGVVDRWNRLHDEPDVLVCDASCFTTGPEKNPTLTAMAIAARAADGLADRLRGESAQDAGHSMGSASQPSPS